MLRRVKVTAVLSTPLGLSHDGTPPMLDAIVEHRMALKTGQIAATSSRSRHDVDPHALRAAGVHAVGQLPSPIVRERVGGLPIPRCSQGIIEATPQRHTHVHRAFPLERAQQLTPKERSQIAATNGQYKSWRVPIRVVETRRIVWFAELRERAAQLRKLLRDVRTIGKKHAHGMGAVAEWIVEPTDEDACWFSGRVLMRPLPVSIVPDDVLGARRDYGAVCGPYWDTQHWTERWAPC